MPSDCHAATRDGGRAALSNPGRRGAAWPVAVAWGLGTAGVFGCSPQLEAPDATFATDSPVEGGSAGSAGAAPVSDAGDPCLPRVAALPPFRQLVSLEPLQYTWFGYAGALDGDRIVAVAPSTKVTDGGPRSAQLFTSDDVTVEAPALSWLSELDVVPGDGSLPPARVPYFGGLGERLGGYAFALSGDVLVVGVAGADGAGDAGSEQDVGRVEIFHHNADGWVHAQSLESPSRQPCGLFGYRVALSSDVLVVGAPGVNVGPMPSCERTDQPATGLAYVYPRSGGTFGPPQTLGGHALYGGGAFGASVSARDGRIAVGAPFERQIGSGNRVGAVYVFDDVGRRESVLTPEGAGDVSLFGVSVALGTDFLVVGAPLAGECHGDGPPGKGRAYTYGRAGARWVEQDCLRGASSEDADLFGWSVTEVDGVVVVGAPFESSGDGAAYVFGNPGTGLSCSLRLETPSRTDRFEPVAADEVFGSWVAASGGLLAVGAPRASVDNVEEAGAVYVFTIND